MLIIYILVVTDYSTSEKSNVTELRKTVQTHMNELYSKFEFHLHLMSLYKDMLDNVSNHKLWKILGFSCSWFFFIYLGTTFFFFFFLSLNIPIFTWIPHLQSAILPSETYIKGVCRTGIRCCVVLIDLCGQVNPDMPCCKCKSF